LTNAEILKIIEERDANTEIDMFTIMLTLCWHDYRKSFEDVLSGDFERKYFKPLK
jgi:hypothetical protein